MLQNDIWVTELAANLDEWGALRYQIQMPELGQFWPSLTPKIHIFFKMSPVETCVYCMRCVKGQSAMGCDGQAWVSGGFGLENSGVC